MKLVWTVLASEQNRNGLIFPFVHPGPLHFAPRNNRTIAILRGKTGQGFCQGLKWGLPSSQNVWKSLRRHALSWSSVSCVCRSEQQQRLQQRLWSTIKTKRFLEPISAVVWPRTGEAWSTNSRVVWTLLGESWVISRTVTSHHIRMEFSHDVGIVSIDDSTIADIHITISILLAVVVMRSINWSSIFRKSGNMSVWICCSPCRVNITENVIIFSCSNNSWSTFRWIRSTWSCWVIMEISLSTWMSKAGVRHFNTISWIGALSICSRHNWINVFTRDSIIVKNTWSSYSPSCSKLSSVVSILNIGWDCAILRSEDIANQFIQLILSCWGWSDIRYTTTTWTTIAAAATTAATSWTEKWEEANCRCRLRNGKGCICCCVNWLHPSNFDVEVQINWGLTWWDITMIWQAVWHCINVNIAAFLCAVNTQFPIIGTFLIVESVIPARWATLWCCTTIRASHRFSWNIS